MKLLQKLCCALLFCSQIALAQTSAAADSRRVIPDCSKENLEKGINSENLTIKKQSIYFAGLYRVKEVVPVLCEKLKTEKDPHIRIMIGLSLYRINDFCCMRAIDKASIFDTDPHVREVLTSIYREYLDKRYFAAN